MQILGVPEEDEPKMLFLTQQMFGGQDEDLSKSGMAEMTPEQISQIVFGAVAEFERYFEGLAAERRRNPAADHAAQAIVIYSLQRPGAPELTSGSTRPTITAHR